MGINDLFVPHETAVKLKEIGFDEVCFGTWTPHGTSDPSLSYYPISLRSDGAGNWLKNSDFLKKEYSHLNYMISAPMYQQVVDWFREKHNTYITIGCFLSNLNAEHEMFYDFNVWKPAIGFLLKGDNYGNHYHALRDAITETLEKELFKVAQNDKRGNI